MKAVDRGANNARLLARKIETLTAAIGEMESTRDALRGFISHEESRSRVKDLDHFAYPMAAKAARERCDRLEQSIAELQSQLQAALEAGGQTAPEIRSSDSTRAA
jgi:hypothetical protein